MLIRCFVLLAGCALIGGCQSGQAYVASNTVIGVHAAVNTARTAGSIQIGYDRQFATVIPRSVDVPASTEGTGIPGAAAGREAMAVAGCTEMEVDGIFLSRFVENLAIGRAARNYASALASADNGVANNAKEFVNCSTTATPKTQGGGQ